ncbi:glycosyltransferase [Paracoccus marinaquae]|uniref:Glycosyl transferase family 28 C-terminal domain-containing protein n=1 Tax=Paracoccus marinaquae TaxID=2841926 RepID=A0ABS6AN93_9RHOB|nr:glycosyltransferase [Paracoccus marinaquae]MBU3032045.1 hypothetical protein [Paracoccus marinaquae]
MPGSFDILYFIEPRFSGGTSAAVSAELTALGRADIRVGICPVLSPVFPAPRPTDRNISVLLDSPHCTVVDPQHEVSAKLVLVHHPRLFEELPAEALRVTATDLVLVLHHPPTGGFGQRQYDLDRILRNLSEIFTCPIWLAPVGPNVRSRLNMPTDMPVKVISEDWLNLIDFDLWQFHPRPIPGATVHIGRHSRPQMNKFPDTRDDALRIYPERPDYRIMMLGAPPELARRYDPVPANWCLLPFDASGVRAFLRDLDVFVYFHGAEWVEAFGYAVLEAIATGVPAVVPRSFEPLFHEAAIYADPHDVVQAIACIATDPETRNRHVHDARMLVERRFGLDQFLPRLNRLFPDWRGPARRPLPQPQTPAERYLFVTSNGVGLGHLTRCLAIARHLPQGSKTAFFTLSQAFGLAVDAGYLTRFIPFHRATGADPESWNAALAVELADFLDFFRPDIVAFDGNTPYRGLLHALQDRPHIRRAWIRRALWAPDAALAADRAEQFDMIIEPGEFSARFDTGPTVSRNEADRVAPILSLSPGEWLDRATARAELRIAPGATTVALMLGAGTNFNFRPVRQRLLEALRQRPGLEIIEIKSPISPAAEDGPGDPRQVKLYPAAPLLPAFDAVICSAGYNSFHEIMAGTTPALFVPNEAAEMDLQLLRARHAVAIGCARVLRANDRSGAAAEVAALLDPAEARRMSQRLEAITVGDGSRQAARLLSRLAHSVRTWAPRAPHAKS